LPRLTNGPKRQAAERGGDRLPILGVGTSLYPGVPFRLLLARTMPDALSPSLLDEIDARQNELLDELDKLNQRIDQVLKECLIWRGSDDQSLPAAA
jgi:hypothetical protein